MESKNNNGFVLALALFRVHAITLSEMRGFNLPDLRIAIAFSHLIEMNIPSNISKDLNKKIIDFKNKIIDCSKNPPLTDWNIGDNLFKECDEILIQIDKEIFKISEITKNND